MMHIFLTSGYKDDARIIGKDDASLLGYFGGKDNTSIPLALEAFF
jgi:hypothetical protein